LRVYALFGSALLVLTVAALYLTLQIYRAASEQRSESLLIEVDQAPEIDEREIDRTLRRIESEEAVRERELAEELEALKEVDLLGLMGEPVSGVPQSSTGEEDEDGLEEADDEADDGTE
jgi:ribosome-binding protein aMBF1 (putative translation factor)